MRGSRGRGGTRQPAPQQPSTRATRPQPRTPNPRAPHPRNPATSQPRNQGGPMRILIPGGAGHLGTLLARDFHQRGDEVIVLSRNPRPQPWKVEPWSRAAFDGADVVINLAGRSVDCRYNETHKREIMESRVQSTREVGEAIIAAKRPPRVWLQASTATIYAHRYDAPNDECRGLLGGQEPDAPPEWHFSIDVATAWERTFDEMLTPEHTSELQSRLHLV